MAPITTITSAAAPPVMGEHTHPLQLSTWIPALCWAMISGLATLVQLWFSWAAHKRATHKRATTVVPAFSLPANIIYETALAAAANALMTDVSTFIKVANASNPAIEVSLLLEAAASASDAARAASALVRPVIPPVSLAAPIASDTPPPNSLATTAASSSTPVDLAPVNLPPEASNIASISLNSLDGYVDSNM
ncbi:MAG: hypothetical protein M1813_008761 [Trichoglossum hirsutum]|nr:MAG: hypothetical protein M1813_008761 [Trichoglossum hirsutum]